MNYLLINKENSNLKTLILCSIGVVSLFVFFLQLVLYKNIIIGISIVAILCMSTVMFLLFLVFGIKKVLLILFFSSMAFNVEFPLYPFGGGYSTNHPGGLRGALVINHFFLIILALSLLSLKRVIKNGLLLKKNDVSLELILFSIFIMTAIISFFFSDNYAAASYVVSRLLFMYLLMTLLLKYEFLDIWNKFLTGIMILLPIQFIIGILQYITEKPIGLRVLGESKNPFREDTVYGAAEKGLSGTLGHPGILGVFVIILIPFLVVYYFSSEKRSSFKNSIVILSILTSVLIVFLTNARTSIAIMFLTFLLAFSGTLLIKYLKNESITKFMLYLFTFSILFIIAIIIFSDSLIERFGGSDLLYQADYRGGLSLISWNIITLNLKNLILGVGPNNYTDTLAGIGTGFAYTQPVHNLYLLLFAEGGILHALCYIALLITIICKMIVVLMQKGSHSYYALAILISILNIAIYNFTGWANYNNQNFILFVVIFVLAVKVYQEHKKQMGVANVNRK
ncbi:hypothetical protein P4561_07795 [Priestia flexa]|uniref:O-antigen ligase family protein n=1 Tax=Priestia flexa TaxID=86664 RepID=UPI002E1E9893|nr:hypothetical protein [Priestia flexa]